MSLISPFFFLLMTPPPPRSTLFPYTTLFRSSRCGHFAPRKSFRKTSPRCRRQIEARRLESARRNGVARAWDRHRIGDRKSTRLNSSHRCISYAVFCLKKKKKKKKN